MTPSPDSSPNPAGKRQFEEPAISDSVDVISGNLAMGPLVAVVASGGSIDGGTGPTGDGGGDLGP